MKKHVVFIWLCLAPAFGFAQKEGPSNTASPATPSPEVQAVSLARQLANFGYSTRNPLCLINAAQLLARTGTQPLTFEKKEKGTSSEPAQAKTAPTTDLDPAKLIADAKTMANGDASLLAMADKVPTGQSRSPVGGTKVTQERVNGHAVDSYTVELRGQEVTEIAVVGDGDTDLDLYLYDENLNKISEDIDRGDKCYVRVTPKWTGKFLVRVKNHGSLYNNYTIVLR